MEDRLKQHYQSIGFKDFRTYSNWCLANGFSTSKGKQEKFLVKEQKFVQANRAAHYLQQSNKPDDIKDWLKRYRDDVSMADIRNSRMSTVSLAISQTINPKKAYYGLYMDMLIYLADNSKLLETKNFIKPLWDAASWHDEWVCSYETWEPKSHNMDRQFSSLVRHLLAKYHVPLFMDKAWLDNNQAYHTRHQIWFIHIGIGQNIRTALDLPIPMTKMAAHHFLQAPATSSIEEAIRWGQVMSMDGSERLLRALRGTRLMIFDKDKESFCQELIRFFIANPMLDMAQVGPLIDYIWNQKYQEQHIFVDRGVINTLPPPQPNLSMNGRTIDTLMIQMERWHRQLGKEKKAGDRNWGHHKEIHDFEYVEGRKDNARIWRIEELVSSSELSQEGRAMGHCVASYSASCASGHCSIWSLSLETADGKKKMVTIEVDKMGYINQMRGKSNRSPDAKEKSIISLWCNKEKITVRSWKGW
jgi:hypothetical protein